METLVVVAMVVLLAVLGTGASMSASASAKRVHCASNMRQIGVALASYALEHNGSFPQTSHTERVDRAWIAALEDYLGYEYDGIRICPADPRRDEILERGGTSYVLNSYLFVPEIGPFGEELSPALNNLRRISEPSRTIMAFIASDSTPVGASSDHTHSRLWTGSWGRVTADIQPDRHRLGVASREKTNGSSNYLFVDGHVKTWEARDVKKRVDGGENIAEPPGLATDAF